MNKEEQRLHERPEEQGKEWQLPSSGISRKYRLKQDNYTGCLLNAMAEYL